MLKKEKIRIMNEEAAEVASAKQEVIIFCITMKLDEENFFEIGSRKINFADDDCDEPAMMGFEELTSDWIEEAMKQYLEDKRYRVDKKGDSKKKKK
jgi:hypothetical protein